ncbi:hypothetical protein BGZ47_005332 [Haplosporangium gracile]|nr:hypothetical protein BGZ47_005332 [Haplosporangium gracile]
MAATQDVMTATGHLRCTFPQQQSADYSTDNHGQFQARDTVPFDRSFHNNTQGHVVQDIQDGTRGPVSSGSIRNPSTGGVSRQQEHQIRVQCMLLQDEAHQHQSSDVWAQPGLDSFDGSNVSNKDQPYFGSTTDSQVQLQTLSAPRTSEPSQAMSSMLPCSYSPPDTQLHRPTSHPLVFDTMDHGRNDTTSQQQQQQHQQQFQSAQHQLQSSQHGHNHHQRPLSLKVEDLDDDTFDSSLAMVLDDHLSLMDHLNMMPDVEVYQSQPSSAASMMRSAEQQQQQHHHQKISVSTTISSELHHHPHQRLQGPMSAPGISSHHQSFFGSSELYSASVSATTSNTTIRSSGYAALSESSIPSPVSPEDPTIGNEMVMIKQEFGNQHPHSRPQQQQHSMLYFDNSALVLNDDPHDAGSNSDHNGDSTTDNGGGSGSFRYVQDTGFMHIKVEPDLDLDSQHELQQQHYHQQQEQSQTTSSSHYTMDRQHPFDATPVQNHQQLHQFQHHQPQGGRLNQSSTAPSSAATATTHGVPILVAEYSHRPHQQQQQ